ncbi:MAG TPA: transposase [Coleofasciculaceae cyanobacterium]|jgi:REP element-mobilizing transposase RayT
MERPYGICGQTIMTLNGKFGRKYTRLKNYNYAANGYYFVTICTFEKQGFFGNITHGKMQLSTVGKIAQQYWSEIPQHSKHTYLDEFIIMPNHVHGIIIIDNPDNSRRVVPWNDPPDVERDLSQTMSKLSPKSGTLSVIIRSYKSSVTRWCRQNGDIVFQWQSRFYENIIRDEKSLNNIRRYIINNPAKWTKDKNYVN